MRKSKHQMMWSGIFLLMAGTTLLMSSRSSRFSDFIRIGGNVGIGSSDGRLIASYAENSFGARAIEWESREIPPNSPVENWDIDFFTFEVEDHGDKAFILSVSWRLASLLPIFASLWLLTLLLKNKTFQKRAAKK